MSCICICIPCGRRILLCISYVHILCTSYVHILLNINIASRFHFQILFVDNDNFSSHIAECIIQNIIEYNDALCTLFPESATIQSSTQMDGIEDQQQSYRTSHDIIKVCNTLGLSYTSTDESISPYFDLTLLDKYDLIISMNEEVQSKIVRSLSNAEGMNGYEQKCRLLSEFLSMDFCGVNTEEEGVDVEDVESSDKERSAALMNMIPSTLLDRVEPYYDQLTNKKNEALRIDTDDTDTSTQSSTIFQLTDSDINEPRMILSNNGAMIPNPTGFHPTISSLIVACTGLTKFCLDTMDRQFDLAFENMLNLHFKELSDLEYTLAEADAQLRRGGQGISGYFSPEQRMERIERHMTKLRLTLDE